MTKGSKISRSPKTGKLVTQPIGKGKSGRFTAVEGMSKSMAASALSQKIISQGHKGDDYRREVTKAFKKA